MPLMKGKSEKAFKHNVRTEMHEGKPQKQSLAIAYSMKRKAKKKASGGTVDSGDEEMNYAKGGKAESGESQRKKDSEAGQKSHKYREALATIGGVGGAIAGGARYGGMRGVLAGDVVGRGVGHLAGSVIDSARGYYDEGGEVSEEEKRKKDELHNKRLEALKHKPLMQHLKDKVNGKEALVAKKFEEEEEASGYWGGGDTDGYGTARDYSGSSEAEKQEVRKWTSTKKGMAEHVKRFGGKPIYKSEGGFIEDNEQGPEHELDMVSRALRKRHGEAHGGEVSHHECPACGHKYSKGGMVANDTGQGVAADELPNEFDDLVLDDSLSDDSGPGNEIGNEFDANHDDVVARAMLKRKGKK